jgi:ATP-binding cassette subfamily F protein 3
MITVNDFSTVWRNYSFSDVSFAINENDKIALMGKNGAGKSFSRLCWAKQTVNRKHI